MKTIPSSELIRIAMQDVADYFNGEPGASELVDEDAEAIGENAMKFRGYAKVNDVVVVEGVVVS